MLGRLQTAARAVPAYVAFRRWQREGFGRAFRRHRLWRRVLVTPPVRTAPRSSGGVEVHTLCYRLDHLPAIWALKTFYRASGVDFPLVIHVNGSPERAVFDRLRAHFPDAAVVPQEEADRVVGRLLAARGFARLVAARQATPFMLKLTDFPLMAGGATVLGVDSDVLFFARPVELVEQALHPARGYVFQRDPVSTYNISPEAARAGFGIDLAERVNTGLLIYPADLPDLAAFERYLADPGVAVPNGFIEQTLYAMHASELGAYAFLPDTYTLDLRAGLSYDGVVARHYAGATRPLMTAEGMPRVLAGGLLDGARR